MVEVEAIPAVDEECAIHTAGFAVDEIGEIEAPVVMFLKSGDLCPSEGLQRFSDRERARLRVDLALAFRDFSMKASNDEGVFFRSVVVVAEGWGAMAA